MGLSNDLISQFVKATKSEKQDKKETIVYGTTVEYNGAIYVRLDGSDRLTPVSTTTGLKPDERVTVMIKNHTAVVTGNISSPSASEKDVGEVDKKVDEVDRKVGEFTEIVADKATIAELEAEKAKITELQAQNATITGKLEANEAEFNSLKAKDAEIDGKLIANEADIKKLETEKLDADAADIKFATIENLNTTNAEIHNLNATYGEFAELTAKELEAHKASIDELEAGKVSAEELEAEKARIDDLEAKNVTIEGTLEAHKADIDELEAKKLSAEQADIAYAKIDFANIQMAAIQKLFTDSGIIKDLIVSDGKITGELVGVTIKGDLIEGNTVKADKLVVKGSDGLFYKLNVDALGATAEEVPDDKLHGSVIAAKSIVAEQIAVDDLVAFGANIAGFIIEDDSIHSLGKESATSSVLGIYLGKDGQFAVGDDGNFIRFVKDANGHYKLEISADSIQFGSSKKSLADTVNELKDEITTNLRIDSSRGTVFKNNSVSTVLSAVIYRGSQRITDITTLRAAMGSGAYLQWKWQRLDDETFGVISASDNRLGNDGFTFTITPEDVDTKVTFMCELIV